MSQEIFKEFYDLSNNDQKYFLMPIAIIPFGSGEFTFTKNLKNTDKKALKIEKVLLHTLLSMQEIYNISFTINKSSEFKTNDKNFNSLLDKSLLISSFDILTYKVLAFIFNSDEIVFAVRRNIPYGNDNMEQLYVDWLKDKYSYITDKLKGALQFFYRTYKFNFKCLVTHKQYFNEKYNYAFFIVYTNAEILSIHTNYRIAILDPSQIIYNHEEIKHLKEAIIKQRIMNLKVNKNINYDIEKRSDYRVYFSWSTGLIEGNFALQEFFEYILIEVELQNKWNGICKLTQSLRKKNRKISLFNETYLAKLEMFTVRLNSLNDAGDSERLLNIKDKIIKTSRITNLIEEYKNLLSFNQQLNAKYISLTAIFISIITLVITIIFSGN